MLLKGVAGYPFRFRHACTPPITFIPSKVHIRAMSSETAGVSTSSTAKSVDEATQPAQPAKPTGLVMQIILRRDLVTVHNWPIGPLLAQSAHAATAVLHSYKTHPDVVRYMEGEDGRGWEGMRKVVLEVPDEAALRRIATRLDETNSIPYHLWVEQPENTPTALALVPNKRPKALKKILDEVGAEMWK